MQLTTQQILNARAKIEVMVAHLNETSREFSDAEQTALWWTTQAAYDALASLDTQLAAKLAEVSKSAISEIRDLEQESTSDTIAHLEDEVSDLRAEAAEKDE